MPLDDRQSFKFGFLAACAAQGLTPAQSLEKAAAVLKQADGGALETLAGLPGKAIGTAASGVGNVAGKVLGFGGSVLSRLPEAGLIGAAGLGAAGGYTLANMQEGTIDPAEVQKQEEIAALNSFREQMLQQQHARRRQLQQVRRSHYH